MVVLIQDQEILDRLGLVEAAQQVWVLVSLRLRRAMEAMEERLLCSMGLTTEVVAAVLRVLPVRMAHHTRAEAVALLLLQAAATALLALPQHRHKLV